MSTIRILCLHGHHGEHAGGHVMPDDPAITVRIAGFVATHTKVTNPGTADG